MTQMSALLDRVYRSAIPLKVFRYYQALWATYTSRYSVGTNAFNKNWDALIVLDACRVDAIRRVAPEYEFLPAKNNIDRILSAGSTSPEWIANTFVEEHSEATSKTAYLANNAWLQYILLDRDLPPKQSPHGYPSWSTLSASDLAYWEPLWGFDEGLTEGHANPQSVTERAVTVGRTHDFSRMIVHYSAPHSPLTGRAIKEGRTNLYPHESDPFSALASGTEREKIWKAYLDHLRYVLDHVNILVNNLDASRVAITADHGELFGEIGLYGHMFAVPHPDLRYVPWIEVSGEDEHTLTPSTPRRKIQSAEATEELEALGYL